MEQRREDLPGNKQALRSAYLNMTTVGFSTQTDMRSYKAKRRSIFSGCCKVEEEEEDIEALEADEKYMIRNGAILLEKQIASHQGKGTKRKSLKIFSSKEICEATNNFDHNLVVGKVVSTVYKGNIDGRVVAVKTARGLPPCDGVIENYLNQVTIKQLIHHKHVIKLHGCCLETRVPVLVTEYMPKCNLSYHLHGKQNADLVRHRISWHDLLRIATEISYALSYMHYALPKPIVHMDVRSSGFNESFTSELSDFGFSLCIPLKEEFISSVVLGTPGYIDPEYQRTRRVTKKCDVYSFGVLLVEILTGKDPIEMFTSSVILGDCFVSSMEHGNNMDMIHPRVIAEARRDEIDAVAAVALKCLSAKGDDRPKMREVAVELRRIKHLSISKQNDIKQWLSTIEV